MSCEKGYWEYFKDLSKLSNEELIHKLEEFIKDMEPYKDRLQSEGFRHLNESGINLQISILQELLEKESEK